MSATCCGLAIRRVAQFVEHARMVRRRVLAEDQQRVGVLEVFEQHRALADADRRRQAAARRLVAHVRAVGEVVRAVHAHEQLVQERSFVAGAARRVERGPMRAVQPFQVLRDQLIRSVPRNGLVLVRQRIEHHRVSEAAVLFERVIVLLHQLVDGVLREERGRHALARRFRRNGLHAVFAEFERRCVLAVRPCAARAVEAVRLVLPEKRLVLAPGDLLLDEIDRDVLQCAPSSGRPGVRFDAARFGAGLVHVFLCPVWLDVDARVVGNTRTRRVHNVR
jgi:hypothetical protein